MLELKVSWARFADYLSLGSLATMCLLPFLCPVAAYHNEWLAMLFGLLAILAHLPAQFRSALLLPRIALMPLALAVLLEIQQLLLPQVIKESAQLGMAYLCWAALLIILAYNLRRIFELKAVVKILGLALLLGAMSVSCLELWFRFRLGVVGQWGGMAQANNYGDYLTLGLVSALYLSARCSKAGGWASFFLAAGTGLIVVGLSLSTSRTILLYLPALAVLAGISRYQEKRRPLTGIALVIGLFLLLQLIWLLDWLPVAARMQTSGERFLPELAGTPVRLHIWRIAWQLFLQAPWLGQGFGQFDWAYFATGDSLRELPNRVEDAHNIVLQLLAETGVLSVLLLFTGLGFWLCNFLKAKLSLEDWWLLALLAVLGLHSMVEYPLWYSYFLGIAAVLLGLGEQKDYQFRPGNAGKCLMGLVLSVLVLWCANYRNSHMRMEKMLNATLNGTYKPSKAETADMIKSVIDMPSLAPYVFVVFIAIGEGNEGVSEDLLAFGDVAVHSTPSARLAYRQILLLALAGQQEESVTLMKQTLKMYPALAESLLVKPLLAYSQAIQQKTAYLLEMVKTKERL